MTLDLGWAFIAGPEGAAITQGYVPTDSSGQALGRSGVTIATGLDLGQHSPTDLARLFGEGTPLHDLLVPYTGLRRAEAIRHLGATRSPSPRSRPPRSIGR